jgi:hypothetical protein
MGAAARLLAAGAAEHDVPPKGKGESMIAQPWVQMASVGRADALGGRLNEYQQQMRVLDLTVDLLIARTSVRDYWAEGFRDAGKMLAATGLSTTEFAHANRSLQNAADYSQQEEFGAAAFELRALRSQLQRL